MIDSKQHVLHRGPRRCLPLMILITLFPILLGSLGECNEPIEGIWTLKLNLRIANGTNTPINDGKGVVEIRRDGRKGLLGEPLIRTTFERGVVAVPLKSSTLTGPGIILITGDSVTPAAVRFDFPQLSRLPAGEKGIVHHEIPFVQTNQLEHLPFKPARTDTDYVNIPWTSASWVSNKSIAFIVEGQREDEIRIGELTADTARIFNKEALGGYYIEGELRDSILWFQLHPSRIVRGNPTQAIIMNWETGELVKCFVLTTPDPFKDQSEPVSMTGKFLVLFL